MTPAFPIPLPLADSDGIVKIVLFGLAALVWVVAQVGSAAKSQAKKRQQLKSSDFTPEPPQEPRGRRPAQTRLERQLEERKREAVQFRQDRVAPPPPVAAAAAPALTYEQIRQSRQAAPPPKRAAVPRPKPKPPAPQKKPPVVAPAQARTAATPSEGPVTRVAKRFRADIGATEIGSAKPDRRTAGQRRTGLRALLAPGSIRDTIAAAEVLRPPVALRGGDDRLQ